MKLAAAFCGCVAAATLAACSFIPSAGPTADELVAQQTHAGEVAFDVVKLDDRVIATLRAQPHDSFAARFKQYGPPSPLKIAPGDTIAVVIWESADGGLFGNSLSAAQLGGIRSALAPTASSQMLDQMLGGLPTPATADQAASSAALAAQLGDLVPRSRLGTGLQAEAVASLSEQQQLLSETGRPGTRIPDQEVGSDGGISIPYAGRVPVAGQTPGEVQKAIEKRLAGKALDPQALVLVTRSLTNAVTVSGAAIHGSRITLSPNGERLLQVIAAAGGAQAAIHDTYVELSRDGVTAMIPMATLVAQPSEDIYARPGDDLTLVRLPQTFSVFGATAKNAAIDFGAARLSLSEALAKAGGLLDDRADAKGVFLFRYEPDAIVRALGEPVAARTAAATTLEGVSPVVYRLDLRDAGAYLLAREFPMHDKDIIFVSNAKVVALYKFFTLLSTITGPVETGFLTCYETRC